MGGQPPRRPAPCGPRRTADRPGADRRAAAQCGELAQVADVGASTLRAYLARGEGEVPTPQATVGGRADRLTTGEKKELAELRRRNRQLEMENEILKRAAAYFAKENVLPK
jgi:transposase